MVPAIILKPNATKTKGCLIVYIWTLYFNVTEYVKKRCIGQKAGKLSLCKAKKKKKENLEIQVVPWLITSLSQSHCILFFKQKRVREERVLTPRN